MLTDGKEEGGVGTVFNNGAMFGLITQYRYWLTKIKYRWLELTK